jgi:hypothetical protein
MRTSLFAVFAMTMAACTTIKLNDGNTNTITHNEGAGVAEDLTARACRKSGGGKAVIISTINKDASLPPGKGRQVTTFRCSSDSAPQTQPSTTQ